MVEDPFILTSPLSPQDFAGRVRDDLNRLLRERCYPAQEIAYINVAFDTAAGIHARKDERRKVPKPFWNRATGLDKEVSGCTEGEPYISHIGRILHFALIEPAYDYPLDFRLLAGMCLHDTIETLITSEPEAFPSKPNALDFVMAKFFTLLDEQGLTTYIVPSYDVRDMTNALSRDHQDVYYRSIGQVFSLSPENTTRCLTIKGWDRVDNNIDLQDLSRYSCHWQDGSRDWDLILTDLKKTLKSYFKTLFVANEIKRYIVTGSPPAGPISSNMRQMPRVMAANMKQVYDIISSTLKKYATSLPASRGDRLLGEIIAAEQELIHYANNGGLERVTQDGELHSVYDGTIAKYDRILRHETVRHSYNPSPLEIYRDARSIQTLLHLLGRKDKPDYYLRGFEWESFYSAR